MEEKTAEEYRFRDTFPRKFNKWLVIVLGAIACIVIVSVVANISRGAMDATASEGPNESNTYVYEVGKTAELGTMDIRVNDVVRKTEDGRKFITVSVDAKNTSKEAQAIASNMFALIAMDDSVYDSNTARSSLTNLKLNPGLSESGEVAFEVADETARYFLAIRADLFDFGGADYVYFDINN